MINTVKNKVFETANKFDLQMGLCGHVITGPEWSRSDDSIPYTKLYCIIDGQGYILHGGEKIPLEPGYVYLLPYDIKHGLLCENSIEKMYFHFTLTDSVGLDLFYGVEGVHRMPMDVEKIVELKRLYLANDLCSWMILKSHIYSIVGSFMQKTGIGGEEYENYSNITRAAMRHISANLSMTLCIEDIADALFVSQSRLAKTFLKDTGTSLGKFIDTQVLIKSKQLLASTDFPINRISEMLGFCDQFYFARKFKSYFRTSPSDYRKHHCNI